MGARAISLALLLAGCLPVERPGRRFREIDPGPLPPGNVRLILDRYEFEDARAAAFDLAMRYRDGNVDVSAGALGGPNGVIIVATRGDFQAALRAHSSRLRTRRATRQFLVAVEGAEASFLTAEIVPVPWFVVIPVYQGAVLVRTIREEILGSGMRMRVFEAGPDGVDVEVRPWFRRRDGSDIEVTEVATRMRLLPGRPYVLLSEHSRQDSLAAALFSIRQASMVRDTLVVLRVEVGR